MLSSGTRAMDAWHLICADRAAEELAEPSEKRSFATRDTEQAAIARELGFTTVQQPILSSGRSTRG